MKKILFLLLMLLGSQLIAQDGDLIISNIDAKNDQVIKENKRIRITTINGEKFQGRYSILDENTIALDGVVISLSDIARIKRHQLFITILIKTNLIHIGTLGLLFGVAAASFIGSSLFLAGGVALFGGGIYGFIKSPNLNKGYHVNNNWKFSLKLSADAKNSVME